MTRICVGDLTIIGSDNGLSPGGCQAIIWINAWILLIGLLGTNFSEILIEIHTFSFKKMHLKMSSAKWRPFCLSLNVLNFVEICYDNFHNHLTLSFLQDQVILLNIFEIFVTKIFVTTKHVFREKWQCLVRTGIRTCHNPKKYLHV